MMIFMPDLFSSANRSVLGANVLSMITHQLDGVQQENPANGCSSATSDHVVPAFSS